MKFLSLRTFFAFFLLSSLLFSSPTWALSDEASARIDRLLAAPKPANGYQYATQWDVGRCAILAEAVATLGWYATPILEGMGGALEYSTVKMTAILGSAKATKALLSILAIIGINQTTILEMSLAQFWDYAVEPQVEACKRVGYEFFDAARSLPTLFSRPEFYISQASDSTGIRNGRFCAEEARGYGPFDFAGGKVQGCMECCKRKLNQKNGLSKYQLSCEAVCHAQFD